MPAAIVSAIAAAATVGTQAYAASQAGGSVNSPNQAQTLTNEQNQINKLTAELPNASPSRQSQIQTQIANLRLVLGAQQNTLAQAAGTNPQSPIQPVVNFTQNNKSLTTILVVGLLVVGGWFFFKKK